LAALARRFPLMRLPGYRLLWFGQTGSALGDAALPVAIAAAVLTLRGPADAIGWAIAAAFGTQAAFSLIGGSWADRRDRRRLMLGADLIRTAAQGGVGLALLLGHPPIWILPASGAVCGAAAAFFRAAAIGLTPALVPPQMLRPANGLMSLSRRGAVAIGPMAAAAAIAAGGPGAAYLMDGASFAVSAWCIARIATSWQPAGHRPPHRIWRDIADGGRVVLTTRWIAGSQVVFAVANLAVGVFYVAGPLIAWHRFGGATGWAVILACWGIGGVIGGMASLGLRPGRPVRAIWLLTLPSALQLLALAWAPSVYLAGLAAAAGMAATIAANTLWLTVLQERVRSDVLGRVTSYDWLVSLGGMCAGLLVTAPLLRALGVGQALTLLAAGITAAILALTCLEEFSLSVRNRGRKPLRTPERNDGE
jgi:MFS family permease